MLSKLIEKVKDRDLSLGTILINSGETGIINFRNLWFDTNLLEEGRENKRSASTPSPSQ